MSGPTEQIRTLLKKAALLRAAGMAWADVAAEVKRAESTCRQWPCVHREEWSAMYQAARDDEWTKAEALAREFQLGLIEDEKAPLQVRQSAAHSLLNAAARTWTKRTESSVKVEQVEGPPEADELPEDVLRARAARAGILPGPGRAAQVLRLTPPDEAGEPE